MNMSDFFSSAKNLSVRFGGVLAVNNVSFDVRQGEVFTLIGPNGAGKTTVFNLISRIYTPTTGRSTYLGPQGMPLTDQPPHKIASLGIARTFQNIELFEHATVLHNLLIGRHTHPPAACSAKCSSPARYAWPRSSARKGREGD
jgi:branched-chain amino acid transport system ATP-binding protein